ncbi:DNA ligase 4 [Sordaria brevicollis]|uniref:DNA ligase n=1 Tax=Sordaria brevicollis TaxID=83679 RepID=A0AAE0UF87_SORBR|nr:DNA ligase 4 [Sordaria brevicollis]
MNTNRRSRSPDEEALEEDQHQYGAGNMSLGELDEHFPNRPHNHSKTFPFSDLFRTLFNPLIDCKPSTTGGGGAGVGGRPLRGPKPGRGGHFTSKVSYHEQRRHIIERFMSRWRSEVGNDFYPAMRLILPDKDRDRGVYGLKENSTGKLLVKVMKIDRNSEDGYNLMHWKLPGQSGISRSVGDFAGRCFEVVSKRAMRSSPGNMTIGDVNVLLDRLAGASGEAEQMPIFEEFYRGMCAEEIMWLVRIILKDMKVGATERTFLNLWHPDAEALFSVSSSLRRVCWELYDPEFRLEGQETGIKLMQCFQPQLAQFQMTSGFEKLVKNLGVTDGGDEEFWIEEKLDGERMQMHMMEDDTVPGGFRFAFWSRKAKDYTYLYGESLGDDQSALTRHLRGAFDKGVRNLILDGEMITWDVDIDKMVPFGTLKTAALEQQKNPSKAGPRPLYRVFDILLLNDKPLTEYTLADRRRALERAVVGVHRRLEILPFERATSPDAIEPLLRRVVAEASEGLVLKNPRSRYSLNSRNNDWIKVKPEYMSEFGESLDCVVVGGYFGSGRRGGTLSSFLCGLRVSQNFIKSGKAATGEKCLSFFKVGGGFKAEDYAEIRHHTEGKWQDWDAANPPSEYIELGGGERLQYEKPDVWIRPSDSVVVSVKAASITQSDQFAMGWTLRFPRFRKLRLDRTWDSALDMDEFEVLRSKIKDQEKERKKMEMENRKRKPATKRARKDLVIAGTSDPSSSSATPVIAPRETREASTQLFSGLDFCVLSESLKPLKMAKPALEKLIKDHGGRIHQQVLDRNDPDRIVIPIADKNVVKVASLKKSAPDVDIIRPKWVLDCLAQPMSSKLKGYLLPFEPSHLFHAGSEETETRAEQAVDQFGDSYARDLADVEELKAIFDTMVEGDYVSDSDWDSDSGSKNKGKGEFDMNYFLDHLEAQGSSLDELRSFMFRRCKVFFALASNGDGDEDGDGDGDGKGTVEGKALRLKNYIRFGNGKVVEELERATHVVVVTPSEGKEESKRVEREMAAEIRYKISLEDVGSPVPRIVKGEWVEESWREGTVVDEEGYVAG